MRYQRKEDSYDEYQSYSSTVLKMQETTLGSSVQGYVPADKEMLESSAPVETMRMKNPDGQLSVGVNKVNEATITITSDAQGPYLRGDRSMIDMNSAKRIREIPDKLYTNSHEESVSGIAYKDDLVKSPGAMINTLKGVLDAHENVVADAVTPFLISRQDRETKKELEEYLRGSLEKRDKDEYEINREMMDRFSRRLARKEKEEQRLLHHLTSAAEQMKKQAKHLQFDMQKVSYNPSKMQPTDGEEDENRGDNQESNQEENQDNNQEENQDNNQ